MRDRPRNAVDWPAEASAALREPAMSYGRPQPKEQAASGVSGAGTVKAVTELVAELAGGVRGAKRVAAE